MVAKILLIDNDKIRRDSVQMILKSYVVKVADCTGGLSLLTNEKFDLILVNITLPDTSGFQVLSFLEKNHKDSKVMVLTGTTGIANISMSAAPGAEESITKLYNPNDLLKSIEHVLSERSHTNLKLQIIKAGDFIKSTPTGDLDINASELGLKEIAVAGDDLREYTILIDLRDVKSRLSSADIYVLASKLAKYGETFRRKTAVLARADKDIDQAKFFEIAAHNQGFNVRAFTDFEDAIIWLSRINQITKNQ
jgi:DNA-binding NarL/FixJ family response regulator